MRNKMFNKVLAGTLATSMVLGMSMSAFAQTGDATGSGNTTGTGSFEGHVDKDVVSVTFPTSAGSIFDYKMDPEGLIAATENAKYSDQTFEEGANVYFKSGTKWTKDSEKLKVINKGTVPVDVTVEAKTAVNAEVAMADSASFTESDTAAKLYLGLKVANETPVAVKTDDSGKVTVGLKGNGNNFEITSTDSGYAYAAKSGVPDTAWNSFEFGLTGACNPYGDYGATGLAGSNVTVTWSYVVHDSNSSVTLLAENAVNGPSATVSASGLITVSGLTAEKNYKSMTIADGNGKAQALSVAPATWNTDNWNATDGGSFSVQLGNQWITYLIEKGGTAALTVTLTDGTTITATGTLTQP